MLLIPIFKSSHNLLWFAGQTKNWLLLSSWSKLCRERKGWEYIRSKTGPLVIAPVGGSGSAKDSGNA